MEKRSRTGGKMPAHNVVVYTAPGCSVCHAEVEFLSQRNIDFVEKNIRTDLDAMQEMVEINSQPTPTPVIDGEVIIGFDKGKISEKLGL
jgi:glutaredoxin 3